MPAPRWKNINVFPWRQESGKEGQLPFVSPFHPFPLFLAPEKYPGRVSATLPRKSNVKRSVRLIERLPASGKSAFPGFSYRTKRWPRSTALKRERRFQAAWRGNGRENACVCTTSLLTFERKGKNERGWGARVRTHLPRILPKRGFVRVSLLSFQSFAEFVPRIKHDRSSRYRSFVSFTLK